MTPNVVVKPPEPPSGSLPIHATFFHRYATLFAIWLVEHFRSHFGGVLFLTSTICVKFGNKVDLSEAASMQFIRRHTSIPVPKIYCAFQHKGINYIVMEKVKGHMLLEGWGARSEASRSHILAQLKSYVNEMRSIKPPYGSRVASVDGGSLYDQRLPHLGVIYPIPTPKRFGPFEDVTAFHFWLTRPLREVNERFPPGFNTLITMHHSKDWGLPIFTHGDLSSLNIMVLGENITGIVDWETAGWMPYYWEYTTASQVNIRNLMWAAYIDRFLEPMPKEMEMEYLRMEYAG